MKLRVPGTRRSALGTVALSLASWSSGTEGQRVPEVELRAGMVITESLRIIAKTYRFPDPSSLPPGEYTVRAISDDAVRVWVDEALVIDHWEPHGSEVDTAPLAGRRHAVRVQYYQAGGWTELRLDFVRR